MSKHYYIFSKADILDKLDLHIDEDKIEDQLLSHRIELKYSIREEDTSDKK